MAKPPVRRPDPPAPLPEPSAPDDVKRIAITLRADGNAIDWDRMRPSTQTKLAELVRSDDRFKAKAAEAAPDLFTDQWCGVIFDAVGRLEQAVVSRVYKVTMEEAALMRFSEQEKRVLAEPLRKVLNKYSSEWLTKYADETALAIALVTIHIHKLQQVRELALKPAPVIPFPSPAPETEGH